MTPISRRYLSRDPIEEIGGLNLFAYCRNNPVAFEDPLGLATLKEFSALMNSLNKATRSCTSKCPRLANRIRDVTDKIIGNNKDFQQYVDKIKDMSSQLKEIVDKAKMTTDVTAGAAEILRNLYGIDISRLPIDKAREYSEMALKIADVVSKTSTYGSSLSSTDALEVFLTTAEMFGGDVMPGSGSIFGFYSEAYKAIKKSLSQLKYTPIMPQRLQNITDFCGYGTSLDCCNADDLFNTILPGLSY